MKKSPFEEIGPEFPVEAESKLKKGLRQVKSFLEREDVRKTVKKTEQFFDIASTIHVENPFTWFRGASRMANLFGSGSGSTMTRPWKKFLELDDTGQVLLEEDLTMLLLHHFDPRMSQVLMSEHDEMDDEGNPKSLGAKLYRYYLGEIPVYWVSNEDDCTRLIIPEDDDLEEALNHLRALIWRKYEDHIELYVARDKNFDFSQKKDLPWEYRGERGEYLLSRWEKFLQKGIRRSIVLHGEPGTGKTTLAREVARRNQARVLFVPYQTLREVNNYKRFFKLLDLMAPKVLIVDDLDRLKSDLDKMLPLFEESENQVPLILATTNHLNKVPAALRRPGRFDEVWNVKKPTHDVLKDQLQYYLKLEGLKDVMEPDFQRLYDICMEKQLSGAHVRELVRRVLVLGWEELDFDSTDLTFSEWAVEEDEQTHRPEGFGYVLYADDFYEEGWDEEEDDSLERPPEYYKR